MQTISTRRFRPGYQFGSSQYIKVWIKIELSCFQSQVKNGARSFGLGNGTGHFARSAERIKLNTRGSVFLPVFDTNSKLQSMPP